MKPLTTIQTLYGLLFPTGSNVMQKDFIRQWKWRQSVDIVIASTFLGLLYPVFGDGFGSMVPFINGLVIGFLGGVAISAIELFLFPTFQRKLCFIVFVLVKGFTYALVVTGFVFCVILVSRSIQFGTSIGVMYRSEQFQHFLYQEDFVIIITYALVLAVIVIFAREMNVKMGQGVLFNFITGRYRKPRKERRIFMFLDMNSSVSKAESLGDMEYHKLLNDFFYDITDSILMTKGIIYQYVGDQVVVTWPLSKNTVPENSLRAYLTCMQKMESLRDQYIRKYDLVPGFKAAFHVGEVIYGEIGSVKSEIVFHGDVVNTTARMERLCSERDVKILLSKDYHDLLTTPVQNCFQLSGGIKLRGKEKELAIFCLKETMEPVPIPEALSPMDNAHQYNPVQVPLAQ